MNILEALVQLRDDLKLWVTNNLRVKVDKEDGKGLSSNDFSNEEKEKLAEMPLIYFYSAEDLQAGTIPNDADKIYFIYE